LSIYEYVDRGKHADLSDVYTKLSRT